MDEAAAAPAAEVKRGAGGSNTARTATPKPCATEPPPSAALWAVAAEGSGGDATAQPTPGMNRARQAAVNVVPAAGSKRLAKAQTSQCRAIGTVEGASGGGGAGGCWRGRILLAAAAAGVAPVARAPRMGDCADADAVGAAPLPAPDASPLASVAVGG